MNAKTHGWVFILGILCAAHTSVLAQIPTNNLLVWFRADTGVTVDTSGTNVTRWADLSGNGNDATQVALDPNVQPDLVANGINGLPALNFNGVSDHLRLTNNTINLTSGLSIFIVARNDVRKNFNGLFRIGPAGTPFVATGDLEIYWASGTTDNASGNLVYQVNDPSSLAFKQANDVPPPVGKFYLYDVQATSATAVQRVNGVTLSQESFGSSFLPLNANYAAIGVGYGGGAFALDGLIAEVVVYNATLSPTDRSLVANRLADNYGLSIPEPSMLALLLLGGLLILRPRTT